MEIKEVTDILGLHDVEAPIFPFLNVTADHIRISLLQPHGVVEAAPDHVGSIDPAAMQQKIVAFLKESADRGAAISACPEYCCPWQALIAAINSNIGPDDQALWMLGCESATRQEFAGFVASLRLRCTVLYDESALQGAGDYLNALCYVFKARKDGNAVTVVLIQFKTHPMGDRGHFEFSHLIRGRVLYRFQNPIPARLGLVTLLCSDTLNPAFQSNITDQLRLNTLLFHLQLNPSPAVDAFRLYRITCCNYAPRSTEIVCLNWAKDTVLRSGGRRIFAILDPRSMLYRWLGELFDEDQRIHFNHSMGCFLNYWERARTAAFLFAPDEYQFVFETTKPYVEGLPQTAVRTGPRMLSQLCWDAGSGSWLAENRPSDHFEKYVTANAPTVRGVLAPLQTQPMEAERLIQLSTGHATRPAWHSWTELLLALAEN